MQVHDIQSDELDYVEAVCLDPSIPTKRREAMAPCMRCRKEWLREMMKKGLQISVALNKPEAAVKSLTLKNAKFESMTVRGSFPEGLIEYMPIERAVEPVKGENSLFINCLWVVPPFWCKGVATALVRTVVKKAEACGSASVLAYEGDKWFGYFPYMPAGFFRKFGFKEVDRDGTRVLLELGEERTMRIIRPIVRPVRKCWKTVVDVFYNSQCPWSGWMMNRTSQSLEGYDVQLNIINTDNRRIMEEYGMSRGIMINGVPKICRMASLKEVQSLMAQLKIPKKRTAKHPKN
jgi:GNAT superfamily N-acetyltransferase